MERRIKRQSTCKNFGKLNQQHVWKKVVYTDYIFEELHPRLPHEILRPFQHKNTQFNTHSQEFSTSSIDNNFSNISYVKHGYLLSKYVTQSQIHVTPVPQSLVQFREISLSPNIGIYPDVKI